MFYGLSCRQTHNLFAPIAPMSHQNSFKIQVLLKIGECLMKTIIILILGAIVLSFLLNDASLFEEFKRIIKNLF